MKRLMSMLLAIVMAVSVIPVAVFAEDASLVDKQEALKLTEGQHYEKHWTAPANGTLTIHITGVSPAVRIACSAGLPEVAAGAGIYTFDVRANNLYAIILCGFNPATDSDAAATVSFEISFAPGGSMTMPAAEPADLPVEYACDEVYTVTYTYKPSADDGEEQPASYTVYFLNKWNWTDVSAYYWGSETDTNPAWWGLAMKKVDIVENHDLYAIEIPSDVEGLIFNGLKDEGSGERDLTPDITTGITDGAAWYIYWENGNQVRTFEYVSSAGTESAPVYPEWIWNSESTEATATVTVPANATGYFAMIYYDMELTVNGESYGILNYSGYQPAVFAITNDSDELATYVLKITPPVGSMNNPEVLKELNYTCNTVTQPEGDMDGYFYTYTAPADGMVTFCYVGNEEPVDYMCDIAVTNCMTGEQKTLLLDGVDNYGMELQMDVSKGDVLTINVIAFEDAEGNPYPAAEMIWCGTFIGPAGSMENPITVDWQYDDTNNTYTASVTVGPGRTLYFNCEECLIVTVNGVETEQVAPGIFSITNSGETVAAYTLKQEAPVGAESKPKVIGNPHGYEDSGSLAEQESYYYTYTATEDVTLILDISEGANITADLLHYREGSERPVSERFYLAVPETDENENDTGWIIQENLKLNMTKGQTVKIQVNALTDWSTFLTPAIDYTLRIDCVRSNRAMIGDVGYPTLEDALDAAVPNDVVKLTADAEAFDVRVVPGVTLDLNGYTLTAEYVSVFNEGNLEDNSADNSGLLKVSAKKILINTSNSQLPVWNGTGYVLSTIDISRVGMYNITGGFGFIFRPLFSTTMNDLLLDGGLDNGVTVEVLLRWESPVGIESRRLVYSEEQLLAVQKLPLNAGGFTMSAGGINWSKIKSSITVKAAVRSDIGVCCTSRGIPVSAPNNG